MRSITLLSVLTSGAVAQNAAWAQCGGKTWTGASTCVTGHQCVTVNEWYSQCQPGTAAAPTTTAGNTQPQPTGSTGTGFQWFGVDQSCAEFGKDIFPGTWGKEFTFPSESSIATHIADGFNIFRVAFAMERLVPNTLDGAFSAGYIANLTSTVNFITGKGAWAILDAHNYGRYFGNIITDTTAFRTFWTNVGKHFKNNPKVIFDTNNEYHDMDQTLVFNLNQAAIDGVRAAGATTQYITVEGNSWTGAWSWNKTNTNLAGLSDPQNKLVYQMHQYLDSDGSGTSPDCVSSEVGVQRVVGATQWLRQNNKRGIIGEYAGGPNAQCKAAIKGMLDHMKANSDVWMGALWWAGGPWWGDYMYSFEPPTGPAYTYYNSLLKTYVPGR